MQDETNTAGKVSWLALASFAMAVFDLVLLPLSTFLLIIILHNPMLGASSFIRILHVLSEYGGLAVGIIAIVEIRSSQGRLQGIVYAVAGIVVAAMMIIPGLIGLLLGPM